MGFPSIARAVARVVSSSALFGEEVTYHSAVDGDLTVQAVVERRPPAVEFAGATNPTVMEGSVAIRREDITDVTIGVDTVDIVWTDGATHTARVVAIIDVSEGFWRLGVKL